MSRTYPKSPPRDWGRACVAVNGPTLRTRLSRTDSPEHLAHALAAERGRERTRPGRIESIETRLSEVRA